MRISDWSSDVCSSDLRRKVVGIMIHVIALPGLARSPMPAAIVRDDPKAFVCEEERRSFPAVRAKRPTMAGRYDREIGSASCRERVCQYVLISGVRGSLKKNRNIIKN